MSRARELANGVTNFAPLASPDFTGTVDLTGTTLSLDNDQISGDKISGGTIGAGTFNGTIGSSSTQATDRIIKHNAFTEQKNAYMASGSTYKTSGNGWSGTTTSQTSKLIVFATGGGFGHWDTGYGSTLPKGSFKLVYHSDDSTQGAAPSGSDLGSEVVTGGYTTGISGRKDLSLSFTLYVTVSVSASTTYHIQVAIKNHSGHYHYMNNNCTGFVLEVK